MFTWDVKKALSNYEKHGVSFEEASTIFSDPEALEVGDIKHSRTEPRLVRVGLSSEGRVLTVAFTIRGLSDGKEAIRIISARRASRKEREALSRFRH